MTVNEMRRVLRRESEGSSGDRCTPTTAARRRMPLRQDPASAATTTTSRHQRVEGLGCNYTELCTTREEWGGGSRSRRQRNTDLPQCDVRLLPFTSFVASPWLPAERSHSPSIAIVNDCASRKTDELPPRLELQLDIAAATLLLLLQLLLHLRRPRLRPAVRGDCMSWGGGRMEVGRLSPHAAAGSQPLTDGVPKATSAAISLRLCSSFAASCRLQRARVGVNSIDVDVPRTDGRTDGRYDDPPSDLPTANATDVLMQRRFTVDAARLGADLQNGDDPRR